MEAARAEAWRRLSELQPTAGTVTTPEALIAFKEAREAHKRIKAEITAHLKRHS